MNCKLTIGGKNVYLFDKLEDEFRVGIKVYQSSMDFIKLELSELDEEVEIRSVTLNIAGEDVLGEEMEPPKNESKSQNNNGNQKNNNGKSQNNNGNQKNNNGKSQNNNGNQKNNNGKSQNNGGNQKNSPQRNRKKAYSFEKRQYFSCIWGYCRIKLEIETEEGQKFTYFSQLLNVLFNTNKENNRRDKESVSNMVSFILDNNQRLLSILTKDKHSLVKTDLGISNFKTISTEIKILNDIVDCYNKNYIFFKKDLKYKLVNKEKIDKFEKLKNVTPETIKYISSHLGELEKVNHHTGIRYMNRNFQPKKVLTYEKIYDYDIYENQVVLGFIKFLISYIDDRKEEIHKENPRLSSEEEDIRSVLFDKYSSYDKELDNILEELHNIYFNYSRLMADLKVSYDFKNLKPTSIFFNNRHYMEIYHIIDDWFQKGNYNFEGNSMLVSFTTIDEIYEYYCLLKLINVVKSVGYGLDKAYNYKYSVDNYSYSSDNTFEFTSTAFANMKITLYYQPAVYSDKFENNISLFRLTGRKNFYTPDFMLKLEDVNTKKSKYLIIDSKWQRRKDVLGHSLEKIVNKYAYSLSGDRNSAIDSVFMLQGKDDRHRDANQVYKYIDSELAMSMGYFPRPKVEIVPFTPGHDYSDYFKKLLEKLVKPKKHMAK